MNSNNSDRISIKIKHLDKIFFGVACVYLVSVLLWLVSQDRLFPKAPEKVQEKPPLSPAEAQFIAYLQQSLDNINITHPSSQRTLVDPSNPTASTIPIPSQPKAVEKVEPTYVPNQSSSAPPSLSTTQQNPASFPLPISSLPTSPTTVPVLTPGQTFPSVPPETALTSPPAANTGYILVGVLESGDRSSALFTFNGVTRRLQLGESIGNSSWVLMGIQDQKAIISFNGKTRYLEVGQAF